VFKGSAMGFSFSSFGEDAYVHSGDNLHRLTGRDGWWVV
jgi:hypothetical protein